MTGVSIDIGNMTTRIAKYFFILTICIYATSIMFGWMNANVDSYFYWAIGEYFRSGMYPFTAPFIYTKPTTISPPLYGLFFILTHSISRSDILLHALQLGLLAMTSLLLYRMLRLYLQKPWAIIISCLFALFPVNLVYASYVLTEIPAQFFVMLMVYLITMGIVKKQPFPISLAVFVMSVAGLMKYNLMIYMPFTALLLFLFRRKMKFRDMVFPILAGIILGSWVLLNHAITGVWGLYDTKGTQLYNQFVAQTKLLPPENNPAVIRMRSLLPPGTDIAVAYWDIQQYLGWSLHSVWHDIDTVLFDVAWASVKTHPVEYLAHSVQNFARMHYGNAPHWTNIGNMGRTDVTGGTNIPYCETLDSVTMCAPVIMTVWSYPVWNAFIRTELKLFQMLSPFAFYLVLLPALVVSLLWATALSRIYAVIYLIGTIPIALTIHVDPRYIVPFYPIACLLIITSGKIVMEALVAIFSPVARRMR